MSDGMFKMAEQCEQEYAETHEVAFKSFLEMYNVGGRNTVKPIWQEHLPHQDFTYKMAMEKGVVAGFYEGKQDTWDTPNIVIEMIGSVKSKIMEDFGVQFPSRSLKLTADGTKAEYEKTHSFVKSCISGEQGDINLGYASASEDLIGSHPLFAYYRRPQERKRIDGRYRATGNVLSRTVCIYRGNMLRDIAMDCFEKKKGFLQIVPNNRGFNYWASINLLIEASVFIPALLAKVHMKDDITVNNVEMIS